MANILHFQQCGLNVRVEWFSTPLLYDNMPENIVIYDRTAKTNYPHTQKNNHWNICPQ